MTVRQEVFEKALLDVLASIGVEEHNDYITKDQCRMLFNLVLAGTEAQDTDPKKLDSMFETDFWKLWDEGNDPDLLSKKTLFEHLKLRMEDKGIILY